MQRFKNMIRQGIDLILPARCPVTGDIVDDDGMLSAEVWNGLAFISDPHCDTCGYPFDFDAGGDDQICAACHHETPVFDQARSAVRYNDTSRDIILRFKHADQMHLVNAFTPWLVRAGQPLFARADYLVPVPLHYRRLLRRRYNQAAELAKSLSCKNEIPVLLDGLLRTRATATQGVLSSSARHKNVAKAFAVNPRCQSQIKDKHIVLIDDVFTTGATISECARVLKKDGGAAGVSVLTVARVIKS